MRRTARKLGRQRTLKMIEQQKKKEQFFQELKRQVQHTFNQQEIDFFILLANPKYQKHRQHAIQTINHIQSATHSPTDSNVSVNIHSQNSFKEIDLNIFASLNHAKMEGLKGSKKKQDKKSKEMLREKPLIKHHLKKSIFDVDKKMKEHYQRIKHRIKYTGKCDTYRATNTFRNSTNIFRNIKSQRCNRYQTQCTEDNEHSENSVPKMLIADLPFQDHFATQERPLDLKKNIQEQRRLQCLRRQVSTGWRRRYRNKH